MYGKLFAQMYEGSLMGAGPVVFSVWPYVIANADKSGYIEINPRIIAVEIGRLTPDEVKEAVAFLCAPDEESRSKEEGGRRLIKEGQYLYRIVNYQKYRNIRDIEARREQNREASKRYRDRQKTLTIDEPQHPSSPVIQRQQASADVSNRKPRSAQAEAEAEAEVEAKKKTVAQDELPVALRAPEFLEAWNEWISYRSEKRKPLTGKSRASQLKQFEEWGIEKSVASIRQSILNGWQGIFEPKPNEIHLPPRQTRPQAGQGNASTIRRWFDEDAPDWARKIGGAMAAGQPISEADMERFSKWTYGA